MNRRGFFKGFTAVIAGFTGVTCKEKKIPKMPDTSTNIMVSNPITPFTMARSFKACSNGKIFIGKPDTDPTFSENQIPVYVENERGNTVQVPQPIVINTAGYPVFHGQVAKFFTKQNYSMAIYDSYMVQQFYWRDLSQIEPSSIFSKLSQSDGGSLVGWKRKPLSRVISSVASQLNTSDVSPWEFLGANDNPSAACFDWSPAIQAAINYAYTANQSGVTFNNGKSASMFGVTLAGCHYGISSPLTLPSGGGSGGAGGCFRIHSGALVANSNFPLASPMIRVSSANTNDWTQNVYLTNVEVDCNLIASIGIQVQKSVGTYIDGCHVTRFTSIGIDVSNQSYNATVTRCYVEAKPYGTLGMATGIPDYGIRFTDADTMAQSNVIIGCTYGIRMGPKCRVISNHMYGNVYSVHFNTQFGVISNNYIEDPIYGENGLADCTVIGNFFSEGMKGGCLVLKSGASDNLRGCSFVGNSRSVLSLTAAGTLALSSTSAGNITLTSTSADFTASDSIGAVVVLGSSKAILTYDTSNTTTSHTAYLLKDASASSFAAGSWSQLNGYISIIGDKQSVSSSCLIEQVGNIFANPDIATRIKLNKTSPAYFEANGNYGPSQGDGYGDFLVGGWNGSARYGLAFGVVPSGTNMGISRLWAVGTIEDIRLGGKNGGDFVQATNAGLYPIGSKNLGYPGQGWATTFTATLGSSANPTTNIYSQNAVIVTSDRNYKEEVSDIDDKLLDAWAKVGFKSYKMKAAIAEKGDEARVHFGFIAQDIIEAFEGAGLDWTQYGLVTFDKWDAVEAVLNEDGTVQKPAIDAGEKYMVRYDECLVLEAALVRRELAKLLNKA